jgi:hypothetical protein
MTTPNGTRVVAHQADGTEVDLTEGVQALYDHVLNSMDWTSGFFTEEDTIPVALVAEVCGFQGDKDIQAHLDRKRHETETGAFLADNEYARASRAVGGWANVDPVTHDHTYSSVGKCMWPRCKAVR